MLCSPKPGEEEDSSGNRALHYAARWGHVDLTNMLFDAHAEIGVKNKAGSTPLVQAAGNGHEVVKLFPRRGANINERTECSGNALQAAALNGSTILVQMLLDWVSSHGGDYGTAFQAAAYGSHKAVALLLLDHGAEVNSQGGTYGNALQAAAFNTKGRRAVVQLLLDHGAEVNAEGGKYGNALQAAAYMGHKVVVQLLLERGAKVNTQGGAYGNALQAAAYEGNEAVVQLLLDHGAEAKRAGWSVRQRSPGSCIQRAQGNRPTTIRQRAEVNAQGEYYGNALQAAAYRGHMRTEGTEKSRRPLLTRS